MKVRFKLMSDRALPPRAEPGDAGLDLHAVHCETIYPGRVARIDTGIAIELPDGYCAQVLPRSGLAARGFMCATGLIDPSYRGSMAVTAINTSHDQTWFVKPGDRIAQILIVPYVFPEIDLSCDLSETNRGEKGFGSTGR